MIEFARYTAATTLALGLSAGVAAAVTVTETGSIANQSTDWSENVAIATFNTSLGTLNGVTITINGAVLGNAFLDNEGNATSATANLRASITASGPGAAFSISVIPTGSTTVSLAADDNSDELPTGAPNFSGSDSAALNGLTGTDSDSASLGPLAAFLGDGVTTFDIAVAATASSFATGSGNLAAFFQTGASVDVTVVYDYTEAPAPVVPLPAGAPLLVAGLGCLALLRKTRKA